MRVEHCVKDSAVGQAMPSNGFAKKSLFKKAAKASFLGLGLFAASTTAFSLTGASQQAVMQATSAEELSQPAPGMVQVKGKKGTTDMSVEQWLKQPSVKEALDTFLQHPYFTYTAKSIYSPAAVPMQWGAIGVAGDVFNRYPSQLSDSWSGDVTVALPFGDSDKWIGGAVSIDNANLGKNSDFGAEGTVELVFSRWLAQSTIVTAGVSNLIPWGRGFKAAAKSYYGAVTQYFGLNLTETHPISATFGLGTGSFSAYGEMDGNEIAALHDSRLYPFANASFNITRDFAVIGDYYSETFAAGIAYNKVIVFPFSFQLYAGNLRHTDAAPSTTYGLRVAVGFDLPV